MTAITLFIDVVCPQAMHLRRTDQWRQQEIFVMNAETTILSSDKDSRVVRTVRTSTTTLYRGRDLRPTGDAKDDASGYKNGHSSEEQRMGVTSV